MDRYARLIVEGQHRLHLPLSEPDAQFRSHGLEAHAQPANGAGQASGQAADGWVGISSELWMKLLHLKVACES